MPLPAVAIIGLNPSKADEHNDDNTSHRCTKWARAWGYGEMFLLNAFALRSTDPAGLRSHPDPVGPANDVHIAKVIGKVAAVVVCWGNDGAYRDRASEVLTLLARHLPAQCKCLCFGCTKTGQPKHPLYLPNAVVLTQFPLPEKTAEMVP